MMDRIKLFHYGCSFSENFVNFGTPKKEFSKYNYINFGKRSIGNREILNLFKTNTEPNSIVIIQWTTLTRPFEDNSYILKVSDNPLYDLLDEWYGILEEAQQVSKEKNLKLIQFIGWSIWKDSELNDYHRNKLKSYGIEWFESKETYDLPASNCYQIDPSPVKWSSRPNEDNLHLWPTLEWGGMSEWIRENVEMENRYIGKNYHMVDSNEPKQFDPHPSEYATIQFSKKYLIPKIKELCKK